MQQMTNVLLSNADATKKSTANSKPEATAGGDNFSAALEKARISDAAIKTEQTNNQAIKQGNKQSSAETTANDFNTQNTTVAQSSGKTGTGDAKESDNSDDVSQVLAQINLANNFPIYAESGATIAADGESLPSDDEMALEQTDELLVKEGELSTAAANTELSDEILQALSLQSGLSEQALRDMPADELKSLLAKSQILDADSDGELLTQYAVTSTSQSVTSTDAAKAQAASVESLATTNAARAQTVSAESLVTTNAAALNSGAADSKQLNATQTGAEQADLDNKVVSRDILGKEAAMQAVTSQAKANDIENGASATKSAAANANQMAAEQLKGAELSVRLTPIKMGLEANLASGNEELSTQDIKTVSGLQAHNLHVQQSLPRAEPQQIQLSLKQHAEQTTQMQEMIQRFSPVMKQQLMTMVSQGVQHAEIRLDPAELGSMVVRIQVQGDSTQVQFQVSQHQTRDLVEQAMPRLREMLAEQGMQLTDGQVSQGNGGNEQSFNGDGDGQGRSHAEMDEISAEELVAGANVATSSASGIDYYA
ncbi:flagellar hook-length control protein FliK [Shewanella sp. KX20019]|uniref:flagellar hook-length control protein FliK n=1 Tax=Shewanella sp. KX20019 TaxID=2803864 RepID=UPI0019277D58|nr:flagellar hook-length control protein FliK [Shewanella sp. KX20019]QQX81767.1 flagellar hook-length control protein FliK [Shewanella sp. KX20019]